MEWTSQTPPAATVASKDSSDSNLVIDQQQEKGGQNAEKKGKFVQRIKQACTMCGSRRVKCDGKNPCGNCLKSNFDCTYREPKKRGPPKGSSRSQPQKVSSGGGDKESHKSQRRSSADVHSQPPLSLPSHLRAQSGGNVSEYDQSASHSPVEGVDARDSFYRSVQPERQQLGQDGSAPVHLSHPSRYDSNQTHIDSLQYSEPNFSRDRELRPSFAPMQTTGLLQDSRYFLPAAGAPGSSQPLEQSPPVYYSLGSGVRSNSSSQINHPYPASQSQSQFQSHSQPQSQPQLRPQPRHQTQNQAQSQSQSQARYQSQSHNENYPQSYPQPRSIDSLPARVDPELSSSHQRGAGAIDAPSPQNIQWAEAERLDTSQAFGAGSTWQPPTRTMPGPLPVSAPSATSSNSPSSASQETSANRGPLYSHYRGGTSGLGFFDSAKKKRQLPPLDFERDFTPGGSLRDMPSLDPNRQLPPILGDSNPSEARPPAINSSPGGGTWKAPILSNAGGASLPSLASSSIVSPPSDARNALESYDAPENITFANGSLHAIAQERRRESSKLIMGNMVKHFGERTPNMSETSRDASRDSLSHQGLTPGDQKDSPSSASQTAAAASQKGRDRVAVDSPRSVGGKSNARRRENSPDEEEAPLALLDMGGLLADEISPLIITASQPRVPSVVIDHLWKIFTYIIHPHWPVLYRPSLGVGNRNHQIDPERQPLLFNSLMAIASATWEGKIDAPSEIRKASEMNSSSQPAWMTDQEADDLEDAKIIMKLNGAQLSTVFFVRARYYLLRAMLEPTLEVIQSLIFMALCENGIGRAVAADQFSSLACRMCLDLGLHRYSDVSKAMGSLLSHEEDQAHRRTFYCCYVLDKHSAAMLGRPPVLRWVETDCPFPSTEEHDEFENWGEQAAAVLRPETALALRSSPVRSISNSVATVKLSIIVERILAQYNTVKEKLDPDLRAESWEGPALRHQLLLEQWERELPDSLRWEYPANQLPHVLLLHLWFNITRIILHRPFILKQSSLPQLPSSHQECTQAASRICQILDLYESMFSLRKLSSTFVFILFTASTIALANLTSNDPLIAQTAKRHLRQFMRWLSIISETWPSAGHHLKILEQLGHDIDANLAGTGVDVVAEANFTELGGPSANSTFNLAPPLEGEVDEQEFVRVHDSSFWEAMPLSSQESVWNNFTSSYLAAVNELRPISEQQVGSSIDTASQMHQVNQSQSQSQSQMQNYLSGGILPPQPQPRQIRRRHTQSSTLDQALNGLNGPPRFG